MDYTVQTLLYDPREKPPAMEKEDTISMIRSLLVTNKKLYRVPEFLRDFKEETGLKLPLYGHRTVMEFLKSIPDTVQFVKIQERKYLKPVESDKASHITSLLKKPSTSASTSTSTSASTSTVKKSGKKSLGVSSSEIATQTYYKVDNSGKNKRNKKESKGESAGCSGSERGSVKNKKPNKSNSAPGPSGSKSASASTSGGSSGGGSGSGSASVSGKGKNKNQITKQGEGKSNKMKILNTDYLAHQDRVEVIPDHHEPGNFRTDVIIDDSDLPKLNLKLYAEVGEYIEVIVSEIRTPQKFSLQLRRFKLKLERFMNRLQLFYSRHNKKYVARDFNWQRNHLCVVLCKVNGKPPKWYRAKILKRDVQYTVVRLIDYGTITKVHNLNLRFMRECFAELPPQAIRGHLASIKPNDEIRWSEECCKTFFEMAFGKELVAGIVDVINEKLWMSVALTNTAGEELHINDTLVERNLAAFDLDDFDEDDELAALTCTCNASAEVRISMQPEERENSLDDDSLKEPKPRNSYMVEMFRRANDQDRFC